MSTTSRRHVDPSSRQLSLTDPGAFVVGCNYWASHAGTAMWSDWRPDVVARDLRDLAGAGLQVLRVFPLWPDFQPIHNLGTAWNPSLETRHGENPLPDDAWGRAGLSKEMMDRFSGFLDLADKNGLRCVVGLITGWMSGRLFLPPALAGRNPLTDPLAIQWQLRFVREFVRAFRGRPAVLAWDLGNECNCMGQASREQAFAWTGTITAAIRAEDNTRPVVSGLHGLTPTGSWTMQDQGELTDVLTTHPYPAFTPHGGADPVNTIRGILHSTAESRFYADIGGKPCFCEEIGTLGRYYASEAVAADYMRACLFSLWANDCHGALWWCAFDQDHLDHAPYDWCTVERELGMFGAGRRRKPVLKTFGAFRRFLDGLPFRRLPPRTREAVCVLTRDQDHWGVAYSSFILAKQAGFDLEFRFAEQPLPGAAVFLLPNVKGMQVLFRRRWLELLEKVKAGATLYLSLDDGMPSGFEELTGLRPTTREARGGGGVARLDGIPGEPEIACAGGFKLNLEPVGATVLAREADGNPLLTVHPRGKGRVFFLGVPLEMNLTNAAGAFHGERATSAWRLYAHVAARAMKERAVHKDSPLLAVTEHRVSARDRVVVALNQSPAILATRLELRRGWALASVLHGTAAAAGGDLSLQLPPCDAAVLRLVRA
ncbi:MAG: cellulase family glycosylhydrolase [Planctomycetota bacterium]